MKKLLYRFLIFIIPFVVAGLILILLDPYNYFGISGLIHNSLKSQISKQLNYALWKVIEFKQHPVENIFLGDSRVAGLDTKDIREYSGLEFYDFAFGGGNTQEIISTFWFASSVTRLKNVYIGLNFSIYNGYNVRDRVTEAITKLNNPFLYLTNLNTLEATYYILKALIFNEKFSLEKPDMTKEEFWKVKLKEAANRYYANYLYPEHFRKELIKISKYCNENKINLIFMIMPVHVELQEMVNKYNLKEEYEKYLSDLISFGPVFNFNFPNHITRNRENFKDPFHIRNEVLSEIMKNIWVDKEEQNNALFKYYKYKAGNKFK